MMMLMSLQPRDVMMLLLQPRNVYDNVVDAVSIAFMLTDVDVSTFRFHLHAMTNDDDAIPARCFER